MSSNLIRTVPNSGTLTPFKQCTNHNGDIFGSKSVHFQDPDLLEQLANADKAILDEASFGIVSMNKEGTVEAYSATESRMAGLSKDKVLGRHFFTAVAPCTNNYLIAQRFELEEELDATIDYVFTLRMKPSKVRLRMLKSSSQPLQYLLVDRR